MSNKKNDSTLDVPRNEFMRTSRRTEFSNDNDDNNYENVNENND